jgi:hypothetical protein
MKQRKKSRKVGKNPNIRTVMTFNKGGTWNLLNPPATDSRGISTECFPTAGCSLHIHGTSDYWGPFYSLDRYGAEEEEGWWLRCASCISSCILFPSVLCMVSMLFDRWNHVSVALCSSCVPLVHGRCSDWFDLFLMLYCLLYCLLPTARLGWRWPLAI